MKGDELITSPDLPHHSSFLLYKLSLWSCPSQQLSCHLCKHLLLKSDSFKLWQNSLALFYSFIHPLVMGPLLCIWLFAYWISNNLKGSRDINSNKKLTLSSLWPELCPYPPNTYMLEPYPHNMIKFRDRIYKVLIKVKWSHSVGPWSNMTRVLIRRGKDTRNAFVHREKAMWGHRR